MIPLWYHRRIRAPPEVQAGCPGGSRFARRARTQSASGSSTANYPINAPPMDTCLMPSRSLTQPCRPNHDARLRTRDWQVHDSTLGGVLHRTLKRSSWSECPRLRDRVRRGQVREFDQVTAVPPELWAPGPAGPGQLSCWIARSSASSRPPSATRRLCCSAARTARSSRWDVLRHAPAPRGRPPVAVRPAAPGPGRPGVQLPERLRVRPGGVRPGGVRDLVQGARA
jgi:hypothetical protein